MSDSIYFAIITGLVLIGILISFVIYFVILYRNKQEKFRKERSLFEKELLKTEIEIREETLTNVSRELHDNFGQMTAVLKINLNLISPKLEGINSEKLEESKKILTDMIQDMKSMATALKGENVQHIGLSKMILKDVERINKMAILELDVSGLERLPQLDPKKEVFLYRMTQEMLSNILKHSKAKRASISYKHVQQCHQLTISDEGIGFEYTISPQESSFGNGLKNMKERCQIIGAQFELISIIKQGTTIKITF